MWSVRCVCKRFCSILTDEVFWKMHYIKRRKAVTNRNYKNPYPILEKYGLYNKSWKSGLDIQWRDLAVHFTTDVKKWAFTKRLSTRKLTVPHAASVDAVCILKGAEHCISGGRDRLLAVWDIKTCKNVTCYEKAHSGWIWDIDAYDNDHFFSCGWDSNVVQWSLRSTDVQPIEIYRCENPAMTIACKQGLVAAGLLDVPRILLIDPRIQVIDFKSKVQAHRGAITDICIYENTLLSVSEDKTMAIYDLRMKKTIRENIMIAVDESFPRSIGVKHNLVYVGDTRGNIHVFDSNDNFNRVQVVQLGLDCKQITAVVPRLGSLIVGSTDKTVRLLVPSKPHFTYREYRFGGEVTSMDCKQNVIAVGATDHSVTLLKGVPETCYLADNIEL
ncbi:F-box/WD repeat-containing protein 9-like isoform X2 [Cimex lectularius]|nr:F-box/WD repeat-containing protein 9-like isoform X2 [Cimex lectularius]